MAVEIIDPVADHQALMENLFDFDRIRDLFRGRVRHCVRRYERGDRPLRHDDFREDARARRPAP